MDKLTPHPDNPNRMSKANFAKLVRNIERTGRYEPLIVRAVSSIEHPDCFQIINGHHRWLALKELGKKEADAIVWDIDDDQADILLATLNRLCGQDVLEKKLALLKRLNKKMQSSELAKLLPQTKKQIQYLTSLFDTRQCPSVPGVGASPCPLVFFVSDEQQQVVEAALNSAYSSCVMRDAYSEKGEKTKSMRHTQYAIHNTKQTKAARRATALSAICQYYLDHKQAEFARTQLEKYFSSSE